MFFFFQAEDGIRDLTVTGVQTCALPIWRWMFGVGCSSGFMGRQGEGCRSGSWSRFASKFWRFLLSMNRTPVAASRQSAAGCCSHELRRSAETPLRQGSWSQCAVGKRSEEHTSELQSQSNLVCRLLLENK